jgi:hypothetical protein
MPIYDVYCSKCDCVEIDIWLKVDEQPGICPVCGDIRHIIPGGYFKLIYNNKTDSCSWGNEGYASSQYWNDVREQRAAGKSVKGFGEE